MQQRSSRCHRPRARSSPTVRYMWGWPLACARWAGSQGGWRGSSWRLAAATEGQGLRRVWAEQRTSNQLLGVSGVWVALWTMNLAGEPCGRVVHLSEKKVKPLVSSAHRNCQYSARRKIVALRFRRRLRADTLCPFTHLPSCVDDRVMYARRRRRGHQPAAERWQCLPQAWQRAAPDPEGSRWRMLCRVKYTVYILSF